MQKTLIVRGHRSTLGLLVLAQLAMAGPASAWAILWATSYDGSASNPSDTVTVDLILDAEPGLQLLSIGILWDAAAVSFDPASSTSPAVILESTSPGPGESSHVERARDPWVEWPGNRPAGFDQVNVDYLVPFSPVTGFPPAAASGTGISLGTLVFHVETAGLAPRFDVTLQAAGNILYANDVAVDAEGNVIPTQLGIVDISTVSITPLPEPDTSLVVAAGLLVAVAAAAGRGKREWRSG